ncbi:DNA repair protein [Vibrio sp. 05-20-BW147]|uniref:DNA repair protein n=1 Tax=Vibrio sp. 05-20-BW147 TaxID=2575834 RepID=UPI0015931F35|nr:DNA repair protein [Vibrio sp. 05-20-BW147]NVC61939.1 DNA repair protein [Vibrio sp. 05-20-BW147]
MNKFKMALVTSMVLSMVGCQSTPDEKVSEATTNVVAENTATPFAGIQTSYQQWQETLKQSAELAIYAPENFKDMNSAWKELSEIYAKLEKEPELAGKSHSLFSGETYAQAYQEQLKLVEQNHAALQSLKLKADVILADSIAQMDYLKEINAADHYASDYNKVLQQYKKLFAYVVVDELDEAQEKQVAFLNTAKQLEVKVIHKTLILPLKQELTTLKKEDFNEVAPVSFATAENVVNIAANIAQTNPRDKAAIELAVANAKFEIEHVKQVTHQVKLLASVEDDAFENSVLEIENKLLAISKAVDGSDYRDVMLREQSEKILDSVKRMHEANKTTDLSQQVTELNSKVKVLETKSAEQKAALEKANQRELALNAHIEREAAHIKSLEELVANLKLQLAAKDQPASTVEQAEPVQEGTALEEQAPQVEEAAPKAEAIETEEAASAVEASSETAAPETQPENAAE